MFDLASANDRHRLVAHECGPFLACFAAGPDPAVVELRALRMFRRRHTECGFFRLDAAGVPRFWDAVKRLTGLAKADQPEGVYVTLNPVNPDLLARADHRTKLAEPGSSATDADITGRRWLLVDVDPVRPAGISATDAEKAAARVVFDAVLADLAGRGWPAPMTIDSGNGFHAWYRIDLPAADGDRVKHCLQALAARHDTPAAKVDTSVFNPSRIVKLPGTWARKGDDTTARPHRRAVVLSVPGAVTGDAP